MEWWIEYYRAVIESEFFAGFLLGAGTFAAVLFVLLLFVALVWYQGRRKNNKGISIKGDFGELFLSRNAIRDAVASLGDDFPEFEVMQVRLEKARQERRLIIGVSYQHCKRPLAETARKYREAVKVLFQSVLGVQHVPSVRIEIKNVQGRVEMPIPPMVSQQLGAPDVNATHSGL